VGDHFVDIGRIVDHHRFNFLFIVINFNQQTTMNLYI
jgi:hypothetical protein